MKGKRLGKCLLAGVLSIGVFNYYGNRNIEFAAEDDVKNITQVGLADAQITLKVALHVESQGEELLIKYDADGDNQITLEDAQLVLYKALKIIDDFPVNTMKWKIQDTKWLNCYEAKVNEIFADYNEVSESAVTMLRLDNDDIPEMVINSTGQIFTYKNDMVIPIEYDIEKYFSDIEGDYGYGERQSLMVFKKDNIHYYMKLVDNQLVLRMKERFGSFPEERARYYYDDTEISQLEFLSKLCLEGGDAIYGVTSGNSAVDAFVAMCGHYDGLSDGEIKVKECGEGVVQLKNENINVVTMGKEMFTESGTVIEYYINDVTDKFIEVVLLYENGTYRYIQVIVEPSGNTIVQECYEERRPQETKVIIDEVEADLILYRYGTVRIKTEFNDIVIHDYNYSRMHGGTKNIEIFTLTKTLLKVDVVYNDGEILHVSGQMGNYEESYSYGFESQRSLE